MTYNARQARQEFGKDVDLGKTVTEAEKEKLRTKFTFVHAVFPNDDYDGKFGSKKFASKILNITDGVFIESDNYKNGYSSLPYKVVFLGESQDGNIGSSPSIDVLPTVKECDEASKTFIESCEINSFPPTMVEDDGVVGQPNVGPRGLIVIRAGAMKPEPFKTGSNPQLNAEFISNEEQKIKLAYKNDIFDSMNYYRSMSAAEFKQIEIEKKIEEGFMSLAPLTSSIQSDFLSPLIMEIDEEVNGKFEIPIKIIYHGRLHIALNAMQTNATETHLAKWCRLRKHIKYLTILIWIELSVFQVLTLVFRLNSSKKRNRY